MSLLTDIEIKEAMKKGLINIVNLDEKNIGPDSIDIRLGDKVLISKVLDKPLDLTKKDVNFLEKKEIPDSGFILNPGQFILSHTIERISLAENIAATIEGRSSIGRYGLMVHMTAGIIHAGFGFKSPSTLTLEIYSVNPNPLILKKGMKIAQLSFFKLSDKVSMGYDSRPDSKYVEQIDPLAPKLYMDK